MRGKEKPRIESVQGWLWQFFCGMCMGAADLVPGISGGTIAFILGVYEGLIHSIQTFRPSTFLLLARGKFKDFFGSVAWEFLLSIIMGAAFSLFLFAEFFNHILNHEIYGIYLYSAFMGLTLASAYFCAKKIKKWEWGKVSTLVLGALAAYFLTGIEMLSFDISFASVSKINLGMIACGAAAICAMLLPGISGSYLLTILGVYPIVLGALANFVKGLKMFKFDSDAFFLLFSLGLGILLGALSFARILSWILKHYHDLTVALLIGFMLGALRSIWPFWTQTAPVLPDLSSSIAWISMGLFVGGFAVVFVIDGCANRTTRSGIKQFTR